MMLQVDPFPKLNRLPATLPDDGAINMALENGVPIFRASTVVQTRIEQLLARQQVRTLTAVEEEELDRYEEIDDYLSHLNRLVRNLVETQ
ncbi:MAG: hypothetical protein KJ069_22785 [Anaerolineae bacterium]|nr:hypothetical protein [Anaerolineae bacterium]